MESIPQIPEQRLPYDYVPSRTFGILFVVLFSVTAAAHAGQSIYHKSWWLIPTIVLAAVMEVAGWAGRLWSSSDPYLITPFQLQITTLILAPTPFVAANFVLLGRFIDILGPVYSHIAPRWYAIVFVTADFISLVIQGVGGGIAATADTLEGANKGGNIMLGGIVFQLAMLAIYSICGAEFFFRYFKNLPVGHRTANAQPATGTLTKELKILIIAVALTTGLLLIRAVYRTIELTDGWNGTVIATESYFLIFDAAMVVIALFVYNLAYPGRLLPPRVEASKKDIEMTGSSTPNINSGPISETQRI